MDPRQQLDGIIRARSGAACTLVAALQGLRTDFSELDLARAWREHLLKNSDVFPFGWYVPPPNGISTLIGGPGDFSRLRYKSLRSEENWPKPDRIYSKNAIIYPYVSAIDRDSMMIGDHVATYYGGDQAAVREWLSLAYAVTCAIAQRARIGKTFAELFQEGSELLIKMGAQNNNFSLSGGLASDLGHTIPFFGQAERLQSTLAGQNIDEALVVDVIGKNRIFVGPKSNQVITAPIAFTIEPQIVGEGLPMASFHMIVVFTEKGKTVVEAFRNVFDHFGMSSWIYAKSEPMLDTDIIA